MCIGCSPFVGFAIALRISCCKVECFATLWGYGFFDPILILAFRIGPSMVIDPKSTSMYMEPPPKSYLAHCSVSA